MQVIIKGRLSLPEGLAACDILEDENIRERKCLGLQLISAKKVAADLNGCIKINEQPEGFTCIEFLFQAPGRFAVSIYFTRLYFVLFIIISFFY